MLKYSLVFEMRRKHIYVFIPKSTKKKKRSNDLIQQLKWANLQTCLKIVGFVSAHVVGTYFNCVCINISIFVLGGLLLF